MSESPNLMNIKMRLIHIHSIKAMMVKIYKYRIDPYLCTHIRMQNKCVVRRICSMVYLGIKHAYVLAFETGVIVID